jgi:hypothetical protein
MKIVCYSEAIGKAGRNQVRIASENFKRVCEIANGYSKDAGREKESMQEARDQENKQ